MTESLLVDWQPIILSVKLAFVTTVALLILATPVAYILAFRNFRGRALVEAVFALPIVLPPTVLGFFVLIAIGNYSPVGELYRDIFGDTLAFSFVGIVLASILYSFPFAVQPIQNAFISVDRELMDAARTLGCSRWQSFWRVLVPGARAGIVTGAMLSFAHTVGEFGVGAYGGREHPRKDEGRKHLDLRERRDAQLRTGSYDVAYNAGIFIYDHVACILL